MSKEKIIAGVVAVVIVAGGVGYMVYGKSNKEVAVAQPVEKVATVNGVEIAKSVYDSQLASAITTLKARGVNTDDATQLTQIKNQVLTDLINNEVLNQAVKASGVTATADEVEKQVQSLVAQVGGADKFAGELVKANLTEAQLRDNISKQLAAQKYLLTKIDVSKAVASEEEITKFYNDNVKGQAGAPALKDVKEQIRQQIVNTKQQQLVLAYVETLKVGAKIETSSL
jgi:hypothetical protein